MRLHPKLYLALAVFCIFTVPMGSVNAANINTEMLDVRPYARNLRIHHDIRRKDVVTTRIEGTIRVRAGAMPGGFRKLRIADYLPGGQPDNFELRLTRANGYAQVLHSVPMADAIDLPELVAGDTLSFDGSSRQSGLQFAGGFVSAREFPADAGYEKVEVVISGPKLAHLRREIYGFEMKSALTSEGEVLRLNLIPVASGSLDAKMPNLLQRTPGYALSMQESPDVMETTLAKGIALLEIHPEIVRQAKALASADLSVRLKVEATLDWINANFQATPTLMSSDVWPPQPPHLIHKHKHGSQFDAARLFQALLAAQGVRSDLYLSYAGVHRKMPDVIVPDFDVALVHVHELGQYVEPGVRFAMLGAPHQRFAGKPMLRIAFDGSNSKAIMPTLKPATNRMLIRAEMNVAADGAITGQSRTEGRGSMALFLHENVRYLTESDAALQQRILFDRQNLSGNAFFQAPDQRAEDGSFTTELDFQVFGELGKNGSIKVPVFTGPRLVKLPHAPFISVLREENDRPFECFSQEFVQNIVMHMPAAYPLPALPGNVEVSLRHASYSAQYRFIGRALSVTRRLVLDLPGTVCGLDMARDIAPALRAAARDINRRMVLYPGEE